MIFNPISIRFIAYTWEQRKLGEMMNITSVKRIHQSDWTDSGVRFLRARDIVAASKNEEPDDYLYISEEKYEEYSALSGKVDIDDLLVTGVGTIGVPYLVENLEPLYFKDGNIIWFQNKNKIDGKFLYYSFIGNGIQSFIKASAGTGTVGTYTIDTGKKTPIQFPSKEEQKKIGEYLTNLDHLITLHQRKYFLSYNNLRTWEQRKLSEISDVRDGTHDSPSYLSDGHPFVTSKNVKDGYINYDDIQYISDEDFETINKRSKVDVNDILMGMIGTIGNLALIRTEPDFAIKNVALIKDTKQVSYMYLYHYLQSSSTERQLLSGLDGGTQKFVSLKNIRELNIMVPSKAEQLKVGNFIESLAHLITLHRRTFYF